MEPAALLEAAENDGRRLLDVAATDWERPVPHCPSWDAAELVRHTGGVLSWMSAVVQSKVRMSRGDFKRASDNPADLPFWYLEQLERTLDVLATMAPDSETWTFSSTGDNRVRWWCRRLAVELAIHRFDIEQAGAGEPPRAVDGAVAGAGIEEFVVEFVPGLIAQDGVIGLTGSLDLQATDGSGHWRIDLDRSASGRPLRETETALRGTRSDLLLWLTNRQSSDALDVQGDAAVLDHWSQLRR